MFKQYSHNGMQWTIRDDLEEALLDGLLSRLKSPDSCPELCLIKDNNVRSVFSCITRDKTCPEVFIKYYKNTGLQHALKHMLVQSKAFSEWRVLNRFIEKRIPCPQALAFTEDRSCRILKDSYLITKSLHPAIPLNEYVEQISYKTAFLKKKIEILHALADLVSSLHINGIFYRDLHAGNILIKINDPNAPELFCIDLHKAAVLPRLFQWMKVRDLAQLCNSLPSSRTDKIRFLKQYCKTSMESSSSYHSLLRKVYVKRLQLEKCRIKSRSKRCIKKSSVFEVCRTWHQKYCGRKDFGKTAAQKVITLHVAEREKDTSTAIKTSSKSVLTVHTIDNVQPLCAKGYRYLGIFYSFKNLFRKSRAMKSWVAANSLLVRGIQTPAPLAIIEKKWGPFLRESFIITSWLRNASELNNFIRIQLDTNSKTTKESFIQACARVLRRMHAAGVYHADLKSNNILVSGDAGTGWNFYFIDLDRVSFKNSLSFYQRANNLAQINASISEIMTIKDRLKFFHFYASGTTLFNERKKYYRKILEISRNKITKPYGVSFTEPKKVS